MSITRIVLIVAATIIHLSAVAQQAEVFVSPVTDVDWRDRDKVTEYKPLFALKTNLLYDIMLTPNISIEVPIDGSWSVAGEWIFAWWSDTKHRRCYEYLAGEVEGRYWFKHHTREEPLRGWFVGLYAQAGYYDLERSSRGARGEMWGVGVSGGYTHRLRANLAMEYSAGLGVIDTHYSKYSEVLDCQGAMRLLRNRRGQYTWWGVTKVNVSLVWMLYATKRESR